MPIRNVIGSNVRAMREARGLAPADLAALMTEVLGDSKKGWTRNTVWVAENGRRAFTPEDVVALALCLDVTVASLYLPPPGVAPQLGKDGPVVSTRPTTGYGAQGSAELQALVRRIALETGVVWRGTERLHAVLHEATETTRMQVDEVRDQARLLEDLLKQLGDPDADHLVTNEEVREAAARAAARQGRHDD